VGTPPDAFASGDFAHPTISRFETMSLIGRLFVILLGFLAASLVAGAIVVVAVLFPALSDFADGAIDPSALNIVLGFGFIFVSGLRCCPQ